MAGQLLRKEKNMLRKITAALAAIALAASTFVSVYAETAEKEEQQGYDARSVILAEAKTGQVLYSQNADERLPIASITKIMTLLIAAEEIKAGRLHMEDVITASAHAFSMDGSVIWLNEGEKMSVYDITRSIVISSANDACVALAEHIGGSEEEFVKQMNQHAAQLGMKNTHFVNCTGLDAEDHYSTASDVAKMAAELRKYDYFDEFLLTRLTYVREGTDRATQLLNTNKLLGYNGITGLKTGTTDNAGYCFTATAKRGEMELVAVVLGAKTDEERFDIAEALLDHGFDEFELFTPTYDNEQFSDITVENGVERKLPIRPETGKQCLIPKGKSSEVTYLYNIKDKVSAPVSEGDRVGKIIVLLGDDTLFVTNVYTSAATEEQTFLVSLLMILKGFFII